MERKPIFLLNMKESFAAAKTKIKMLFPLYFGTIQDSFLPTMPEDNFLECIDVIAKTMKGTGWVGEWYGECFRV